MVMGGGFTYVDLGVCSLLLLLLLKIVHIVWLRPMRIQKQFHDQGIGGPPYRPLIGNLKELAGMNGEAERSLPLPTPGEDNPHHTIFKRMFPHLHLWHNKYGKNFIFWFGPVARLVVADPELKITLTRDPQKYLKNVQNVAIYNLIGNGIVQAEGEVGASRRKLLNPLFNSDALKINMIINETLRLYPPVPYTVRGVNKETKLGGLTIPAGVGIIIPIVAVHYDPEQWGSTVDQFDPNRFAEGISKASKHPMAFMPFTHGPRMCIGMKFVTMELMMILAMILQRFTFVLSPNYKHHPLFKMTLNAGEGAKIIFQEL